MTATGTVGVDGLDLHVARDGAAGGVPVLMIHGWPDTGRLWRHQVPALAAQGYRVLTPDLRGMGQSGRPNSLEGYRVRASVGDMLAVLDDEGVEDAHIVSHDLGAVVGWTLACTAPHRVRSLTALSVGHPNAFAAAGLRQLQASWYMLLFQFEGIAEEWLSAGDWAMFRRLVGHHPETEQWIENLSPDGALTSSLNWYRANFHPRRWTAARAPFPTCRVPALGVWSSGDRALTEMQMEASGEHATSKWRYERLDGPSHWIPLDAPERLNRLLLEWLAAH